jgi:hypothetical protein
MATPTTIRETVEYRVVLVQQDSPAILAFEVLGYYCLPRVKIPRFTRPAQQLRTAIEATLGLDVLVLDVVAADQGATPCAVAELLTPGKSSNLKPIRLNQILDSEFSEEERSALASLLNEKSNSPLSRIGWIDEAFTWIKSATKRAFSSKKNLEQLNSGGGFALLRFNSDDGCSYWLKATGAPNIHEYSITSCLSALCPDFLPKILATRKEWNAWLSEDAGEPLPHSPSLAVLARGTSSLALLQLQTTAYVDMLLSAGAFDQRLPVLRNHIDKMIAYLIDAMERQNSRKVEPLSRDRLLELGKILHDVCSRLEELGIPDALIHNDLNLGNVLYDGTNCVFTDWSEGAVGNPFLSFERFCLLSRQDPAELRRIYRKYWSKYLSDACVDNAYKLTPLLAIFAYLYSRGDWLEDTGKVKPQFESYARSLARHMSRAAENPVLLATLCN